MPRSAKKKKPNEEPEPSSSSSGSDGENDLDELSQQENIQIELEARTPIDADQSTIVYFLEQSFGHAIKKSVLDLNQLATQLVGQHTCGSVFYQPADSTDETEEDDDDDSPVLGVCSFLRFDQQLNKQLQAWLMDKCSTNEQAKSLLQCKFERKKKKKSSDWTSWDLNPRLFACKANTLPLSYKPMLVFTKNIRLILFPSFEMWSVRQRTLHEYSRRHQSAGDSNAPVGDALSGGLLDRSRQATHTQE